MSDNVARYIDHTLLRPTATPSDVERLCEEAQVYGFASVCLFPAHVGMARRTLVDSPVRIATVIAFPFGATFTEIKASELHASFDQGAHEADFVINLSLLKAGDDRAVEAEMRYLADSARELGVTSKFIIEAGYLDKPEKVRICQIANRVSPDYLKTSTGFGPTGATVADVELMRATLRSEIHIKAAGGIRSYPQALAMLRAGASRIGTSSGIAIVEESRKL
jgi:deoxyribose-phosphate aldolase